jgi:hypothetical protein
MDRFSIALELHLNSIERSAPERVGMESSHSDRWMLLHLPFILCLDLSSQDKTSSISMVLQLRSGISSDVSVGVGMKLIKRAFFAEIKGFVRK